jgi:hypothetical protein
VYAAAVEMHKSMAAELKTLGVPFFGTKAEGVTRGGSGEATSTFDASQSTQKVTEEELHLLQRRMVQYLEDMYG